MKNVAILLIATAVVLAARPDLLDGGKSQSDAVPVVVPEECRTPIDAIRSMNIDARDGAEIASFYGAFADVLENDTENWVGASVDVRVAHQRCGKLTLADKGIYGRYSGLAGRIDEALAASIGSTKNEKGEYEPVVLNETKKRNLAQAARAVAWAVKE